jgi:hypothetical protein
LNIEKIAAFAPMPSASDRMATAVTNGVRNRVRKASFRSRMAVSGGGRSKLARVRTGVRGREIRKV